jgi:hypothetical protein
MIRLFIADKAFDELKLSQINHRQFSLTNLPLSAGCETNPATPVCGAISRESISRRNIEDKP